jgi:hypothetical protein
MRITINNWENYNPKRDQKTYSWLRLENTFALDPVVYEFDLLTKFIWVLLLCEASKKNEADCTIIPQLIAIQAGCKSKDVIQAIENIAKTPLLTYDRATTASGRITTPTLRDERDDTNDSKKGRSDLILEIWNEECGELPKIMKLTQARKTKVQARLKEYPDLDLWRGAVRKLAQSKFCNGGNDQNWKASFDFLLKPDSIAKAIEGTYDNKKEKKKPKEIVVEL